LLSEPVGDHLDELHARLATVVGRYVPFDSLFAKRPRFHRPRPVHVRQKIVAAAAAAVGSGRSGGSIATAVVCVVDPLHGDIVHGTDVVGTLGVDVAAGPPDHGDAQFGLVLEQRVYGLRASVT